MPLEDDFLSKEKDGQFNESYCKWCYVDGEYTYHNMDDLINNCIPHMVNEQFNEEQVRTYLKDLLPTLDYWKTYQQLDEQNFERFKQILTNEINALQIEGMPKVKSLNELVGSHININFRLPNGNYIKFLDDHTTYLGNQLKCIYHDEICFGIVANMDFILVCSYEKNGENAELIIYKKR